MGVAAEPEDDASLGARLAAGDATALEDLHHRYAAFVERIAARTVSEPSAVEDIVQTVFLRLWESRQTLRRPDRLKAWLRQTASHLAADHHRTARAEPLDLAEDLSDRRVAPASLVELREAAALVREAAGALSAEHRRVIGLALGLGLSNVEVAQRLGVSPRRATILMSKSRSALERAIRSVRLRRASSCARFRHLLPADGPPMSHRQRIRVDHHVRRCPACRGTLAALPPANDAILALSTPAAAGLARQALAGFGGPSPANPGRFRSLHGGMVALAAGALLAAAVGAAVVVTGRAPTRPAAPAAQAQAKSHPLPVAGGGGRVLVTGADPDAHSSAGANRSGARAFLLAAIRYVLRGARPARILLVTDLRNPDDGVHVDPRLGLRDAGLSFDVATAGPAQPGSLPLTTVDFSAYSLVVIASDYGGWLRQDELDALQARRADLAGFVRQGGGLLVLAEGGGDDPRSARLTTGGWYAFVGAISFSPLTEPANGVLETSLGSAAGFTTAEHAGNYVHATFAPGPGLQPLELLGGRILTCDATALLEATPGPGS